MMENRLEKITIVDQVFLALRMRIVEGEFVEGDKLPSEAALAAYYEVNRLSVRMAIQKLGILGLTETRTGEGTFVKRFSINEILRDIGLFYDGLVDSKDIQQLRYVIEMGCARIALNNIDQRELKRLKEILNINNDSCIEYLKDNTNTIALDRYIKSDIMFHKQIVNMSGNKLITDLYDLIASMVQSAIRETVIRRFDKAKRLKLDSEILKGMNETHNTIYKCIATGNRDELDLFYRRMLGLLPLPIDEMCEGKTDSDMPNP